LQKNKSAGSGTLQAAAVAMEPFTSTVQQSASSAHQASSLAAAPGG
jgi:hypothetical protein